MTAGGTSCMVLVYITVWMVLSTSLILFNAVILQQFGHPIALGAWHMAVCSLLTAVGRAVYPPAFSTGDPEAGVQALTFWSAVKLGVPVAAMQAVGMAAGNVAYMLLTVSFVQMVKAWTSACVYLVGCFMGVQTWSRPVAKTIAVITVGLTLASLWEINFNLVGFLAQMISLLSEGFRINLLETRLKSKGYKLNPLSSLMIFAPIMLVLMTVMSLLLEGGPPPVRLMRELGFEVLTANALLAFFLNISIFIVIQCANGLVFALSGVLKDVLIIFGSFIIFDTSLTGLQLLGYSMAIGGLQAYLIVSKAPQEFENGVLRELWRRLKAIRSDDLPKGARHINLDVKEPEATAFGRAADDSVDNLLPSSVQPSQKDIEEDAVL